MRALPLLLLALALAACDATSETDEVIDLMTRAPWVPVDPPAEVQLAERYDFRDNGRLVLTFPGGSTHRTEWALDENATVVVVRDLDGGRLDLPLVTLTEDDLVLDYAGVEVAFVHP